MKGQVRIKQRLLGIVGIIFSLGLVTIGVFLIAFQQEVSAKSIVGSSVFLWLGLGYLGLLLMNMKTIRLSNKVLTIGTFYGLIKTRYRIDEIEAVNPKSFRNRFNSYPGLLMKFRDGRQIHIHGMEFKNFVDLKNIICDNAVRNNKLEVEIWTPFAKVFVAFGGLILLLLIVVKSLEL